MKNTGLVCLYVISQLVEIPVDEQKIKHEFSLVEETVVNKKLLVQIAHYIGYKTRVVKAKKISFDKLPTPCIVEGTTEDNFIVIIKVSKKMALIMDPLVGRPQEVSLKDLKGMIGENVILLKHQTIKKKTTPFGFKWFIPTILKYKKVLIEVLVAAFMIQLLGLFGPIITQVVVDKVLVHSSLSTLNVLAVGLALIAIFELIFALAKNYVFSDTTNKIDVLLSSRLYDHLVSLPLRYFEARRVGDTVARVRELETIRQFLTGTPMSAFLDLLFLIVYIIVMFFYSFNLTLIVILTIPFFVCLSAIATPLFKERLDERFTTGAESQSFLVESVTGMNTIKSLALEPKLKRKWNAFQASYILANFKSIILTGNISAIGQFIQKISDLLILWIGAKTVIDGQLTVGQLIAFRMLAGKVSGPILRIVQIWQEFQQTNVSVQRMGDIFNTPTEESGLGNKTRLGQIKGQIEFENVTFRYNSNRAPAINQMNFTVPPNTIVGIVGRSGSGKSTLTRLIQRLYIPETGKIMVDGSNIAMVDTAWLRSQIGVVLQENFLFNLSIRDNIAINNPGVSTDKVIEAARAAGAHDFILEFPEGYDTMVGEQGVGLSGGQKQRIAIARALITNPKILIFDEATSALDYESERIIQENMKEIVKHRTVLIIAHRLSTVRDVDMILSLDNGYLLEKGTIEELLSKDKGVFKSLYQQQGGSYH